MNKEAVIDFIDTHAPNEVLEMVWDWMVENKEKVEHLTEKCWCDHCEDFRGVTYHMTHRQTLDSPEEGVFCCADCGRVCREQ